MADTECLEITITHNLRDVAEVRELFDRRLIGLDWGRKGPDPNEYTGRARTDVKLFHTMREMGAAVIGAYKKATTNPSDRLVGRVAKNAVFERVNELLCLPLSDSQIVDSSKSFLGNLPPRSCTVQRCSNRARGRLDAWASGTVIPHDVSSLHHHDVEWLVTKYLVTTGMCACVWSGARAFEDIDHAGSTKDGRELLAQTTVSVDLVGKKAKKLLKLAQPSRVLHFFGPAEAQAQCPVGIIYHPIEMVFSELDRTLPGGGWLIDRMLGSAAAEMPASAAVAIDGG